MAVATRVILSRFGSAGVSRTRYLRVRRSRLMSADIENALVWDRRMFWPIVLAAAVLFIPLAMIGAAAYVMVRIVATVGRGGAITRIGNREFEDRNQRMSEIDRSLERFR